MTSRTPGPISDPAEDRSSAERPTTLLTTVLDRSGSMGHLHGAVVEGVNDLLGRIDPATRVTIAQFDSQDPYEVIVDGIPAAEIEPLRHDQYRPRGGTPLFDAVGRAIATTAGRAREVEILTGTAPAVVLAIVTDGYENASSEYRGPDVARLLDRYRSEGWTVTYIGLGLGDDAFTEAASLGLDANEVLSLSADFDGAGCAFMSIAELIPDEQ